MAELFAAQGQLVGVAAAFLNQADAVDDAVQLVQFVFSDG